MKQYLHLGFIFFDLTPFLYLNEEGMVILMLLIKQVVALTPQVVVLTQQGVALSSQ